MNTTPDYSAAGEGGSFDPAQAAALLDQTTQQTRRKTAPAQPWLLAIRAVAVLLVLGACWLNVRGQHPYHGPTFAVLPFVWGFVIVNFVATVGFRMRATAGVTGKSRLPPGRDRRPGAGLAGGAARHRGHASRRGEQRRGLQR